METYDELLPKKPKRSFVEAWLNDKRYKCWIRKVSSDDSIYYCTICDKNFSCNAAHVSRHADSARHQNRLKENVVQNKTQNKSGFQYKWLEIDDFKLWLSNVSNNKNLCLCKICDKTFYAHLSHIRRHAISASHSSIMRKKGIQASKLNNNFNTQDKEYPLSFDERKKSAEIRYAALIAERNIPHQIAKEIMSFFQDIGEDVNVLKSISMGRTKCKNIISNVLYPVENERVVHNLQKTKFSVFIDETPDICNEKWMTLFVRYVDPETLDIRSQLVKLINIDAKDCTAENLFHVFKREMCKLQIPFLNIVALSCNNSSIMTGKYLSFKTKLEEMCNRHLLTFSCPCHSATLIAQAACTKIPSFCDDFLKKIVTYIHSSPKRSAIFQEFCKCFQEKNRKMFKLSETHWLSHHMCVEKILDSWNTIEQFLQKMVVNGKKIKSAQYLLFMMSNIEMKAYFLFLKYILHFFSAFNTFFQSAETKIHLLHMKSVSFLSEICQNFVKEEYLKNIASTINFAQKDIQKDNNEIYVGSECEEYLKNLITEGHADIVATVRQNCLQFYLTAAKETRKRLPITDDFLKKLKVFQPYQSLFDTNRETSLQHVFFVAKTLGDFDEEYLRKEWFALSTDLTVEEKTKLSQLPFDEMWKEILQRQLSNNNYKYPTVKSLLSAVRALPNSNVDSERTFLILTDVKSKKRNNLSSTCVNATCVVKSALKTRGETAVNMKITAEHLSRMSSDKLYATCSKEQNNLEQNNLEQNNLEQDNLDLDVIKEEYEEIIDDGPGPSYSM